MRDAAMSAAQRFYAERLARPGNPAAKYLESRGVPEEMWSALSLGHDDIGSLGRDNGGVSKKRKVVRSTG